MNLSCKKFGSNLKANSDILLCSEFKSDQRNIGSHKIHVNIWWDSHVECSLNTIEIPRDKINNNSAALIAFGLYFNTSVQKLK